MKLNIKTRNNVQKKYSVFIGEGILGNIARLFDFSSFSKIVIITDRRVANLFLKKIKKDIPSETEVIILPVGEEAKNIDILQVIWKKLLELHADRKTLIMNLGGGVVCDMGGFAASTFMRGLRFVNIPTTLLSQVDASIGGKTGINFNGVKNLIGTISLPMGVVVDTQILKSLPKREFLSGFAEIIKHGLICDKKFFSQVTAKLPLEFDSRELVEIITRSIKIKTDIVEKDVNERNLRKTLNFGHTIGHAVEVLSLESKNLLLHGEAVSVGMVGESKLANLMGRLPEEDFKIIERAIEKAGLPVRVSLKSFGSRAKLVDEIQEKIVADKKNNDGKILWSLPSKLGQVDINVEAPKRFVLEAIEYILN